MTGRHAAFGRFVGIDIVKFGIQFVAAALFGDQRIEIIVIIIVGVVARDTFFTDARRSRALRSGRSLRSFAPFASI